MNSFLLFNNSLFISCHCRYIGLPPSWSTSLANAGFTPDEIANIQARRAAGSLTPDLRYLYTERPTSPQVAGFQHPPSTEGPLLSNPASRSASLPLSESLRPPPILTTSASFTRRPPPNRKPPLPSENHLQNGHTRNLSSSSTGLYSNDSHNANSYVLFFYKKFPLNSISSYSSQTVPFSSANNSTPYRYPSASTSNLSSRSTRSTADEDGQTPLAKVPYSNDPHLHSSHAEQSDSTKKLTTAANASGVLQGGETEDRPRSDDRGVFPKSIWGVKRNAQPSSSSLALSTSSPSVIPLYNQQQQISQSALSSNSTSFAAAASSSLSTLKVAAASTSQSIASVVRNTKGVIRRGLGTSKDNGDSGDVENAEDEMSISDSLDIDAAFGADDEWSTPAGPDGRKAVWQLYTRPKTSTDGSSLKSVEVNQQHHQQHHQQSASTTGEGNGKSYMPFSKSQGSLRSLTKRKLTIKKANSQASLITNSSVSQRSMNSASGSASGSGSGFKMKHQNSESITSLASIPETSALPYTTGSSDTASSSSIAHSVKQSSVAPHLTLLHQSKASLDLSLWSEALISGLAKSVEMNLGETGKGKERDIGERVTGNGIGVKGLEKGKEKDEGGSGSAARPFGYPTNTNRNVLATAAGMSRRQQPPTPTPRYPVPATPVPPFNNNNNGSSSSSSPLTKPPTFPTSRSRSNSRSTPTGLNVPPPGPAAPSPLSGPPLHYHGYGQSPKPPPAVPLPPPPSDSNVPNTSNNYNNTILTSALMARRGILSPPPTSLVPVTATMFSPPASAQSLKTPLTSTSPDSAQIWSQIETMMNPELQGMAALTGGLPTGEFALGPPPRGMKGSAKIAEIDIPTVGDLVGNSPGPTPPALSEASSPVLPFSPEEERMAVTRELRAGEGVLGTKSQVGMKKVEERDSSESMYVDGISLEKGEGSSNYIYQEEPTVYNSKAPESTNNKFLTPDNRRDQAYRDSTRSSMSTLTPEEAVAATTIVRKVSIARRAGAVMINGSNSALLTPLAAASSFSNSAIRSRNSPSPPTAEVKQHPSSPLSSCFENSSEESAGSLSLSLSPSSPSQDNYPTPATDSASLVSPLLYYLDGAQTPSPTTQQSSGMKAQNEDGVNNSFDDYNYSPDSDDEEGGVPFPYPDETTVEAVRANMAAAAAAAAVPPPAPRPTIVISDEPHSSPLLTATTAMGTAPLSPFQQYRGWLSAVVAPLEEFIDETVDPRNHYLNLTEIAEGESGSVYSACLNPLTASKLRLPPAIKAKDAEDMSQHPEQTKLVAIKSVAIVPSGSPKLVDLQRELTLMKGLSHENVLGMDGVYVDLVEDSLWVRMELMERSLADLVGLVGDGLMLQDRMLARFASDVSLFFCSCRFYIWLTFFVHSSRFCLLWNTFKEI